MTKRESSVEEGGSILQMLAMKGSRKEELHGNYKNTEKKKSFYCGRLISSVVLWNGVSRGWQGGGEGEWKVGYGKKKIRVWLNKEKGQVIGKELVFWQQLRTV